MCNLDMEMFEFDGLNDDDDGCNESQPRCVLPGEVGQLDDFDFEPGDYATDDEEDSQSLEEQTPEELLRKFEELFKNL